MMRRRPFLLLLLLTAAAAVLAAGCGGLKINVGAESRTEPLREYVLEGDGPGKVLLIPIRGFISDTPRKGLLRDRASVVEDVAAQLAMAARDDEVRAVVLAVNSPGGSVTASDILYHEIAEFKEKTGAKIVAVLMDVGASGGYYIALPADRILAHPTTITGSVGVIFVVPKVTGLMDKLGVAVEVSKSGREKDMASPFRASTPEEQKIIQGLTDRLGAKFLDLVARHRRPGPEALAGISTARIYLADEALQLRLIDGVGYLKDAMAGAKELAGLSGEARIVVYRRDEYPNDNVYNTGTSWRGDGLSLVDINLADVFPLLHPGFYYLWAPGHEGR